LTHPEPAAALALQPVFPNPLFFCWHTMTTTNPTATEATSAATTTNPAGTKLHRPIVRGEHTITHLQLREPSAGELRGISLSELLQMQTTALVTLLPRVTEPPITKPEASALSAPDLINLGGEVLGFLVPDQVAAMTAQAID